MLILNTPSESSNGTYPVMLLLLFILFSFLCCFCGDFLIISANQKWNLRLSDNEQKKIDSINAHRKYSIRGFERHLPSDVDVDVAVACVLFSVLIMCWLFKNKRQTKMKLKVSAKWTEQKNCGNAHPKCTVGGFDRHLPSDFVDAVSSVFFFVLLLHGLFENKRKTKMKLRVSGELTEQKNGGSDDLKCSIRVSNITYPLLMLLLLFQFLCCCCGYCYNKNSTLNFLTHT